MKSICIYVLHWDKLTDRMKNIQRLRDLVDKQTSCVVEIILVDVIEVATNIKVIWI